MEEFGAVYGGTVIFRNVGTIFADGKKEGEELQNAVFAIFIGGIFVYADMKKLEGSFTIESAVVMPVLIFMLVSIMQLGLRLYTEETATAIQIMEKKEWNAAEEFYRWEMIGDIIKNEN